LKNRMKEKKQNRSRITRVVAFDCDGVMFDSSESNKAYYNQVLTHFGKPGLSPEQFAFTHMHTADDSMAFLFDDKESLEKAQAYRKQMTYMPFIRHMEMEPHLKPLLNRLRIHYKTAIASNRTDTMAKVLEVHGLENDFDFVVSALDVPRPKPYPDQLYKIMDYFKVSPEEIIYVGDSEVDEKAAAAAGVPLVAYDNPGLSAEIHIKSLKELENILL
jgi:phosphoglycolate phosphatase